MKQIIVAVYRIEVTVPRDSVYKFEEAVSDYAITSVEFGQGYRQKYIYVVASTDALNATQLHNVAIKFFGENNYNIMNLGTLGPFKKHN